jgi:CHAT domain-containing protein/tetratricopeptide (TPR) repeat protein
MAAAAEPESADDRAGTLAPEPGSAVRKEIAAGETHRYEIHVKANQFLRITVTQQGLSVSIDASAPGGKRVAGGATPDDTESRLQLSMIAEVSGDYHLEVRSLESHSTGSYEIRVAEVRPAAAGDEQRVEAGRLFAQAEELYTSVAAESTRRAIGKYEEALALWREVRDQTQEALALSRIGRSYNYLGESWKAVEFYKQALGLMTDGAYSSETVSALNGAGYSYLDLGENQQALDYFSQALLLSRKAGDKKGEARSLYHLGTAYALAGDNEGALEWLNRALAVSLVTDDRSLLLSTLQSVGTVYVSMGRYAEALKVLNEALALGRAIGDKREEALVTNRLGRVSAAQGRFPEALAYYKQALVLSRYSGMRDSEAETLYDLGLVHSAIGRSEEARDYFSEALSLSRASMDKRTAAKALYEIAKIERRAGELDASRTHIEAALSIVDLLHATLDHREQGLRTSYFASVHQQYELYISLLMQLDRQRPSQGFAAAALQVSERARARSLLETLTQARVSVPGGVDQALLERERSLRKQLAARTQLQLRLRGRWERGEQGEVVVKEVERLTAEFQSVEAQIRIQSPRYASLTQPRFLSAAEIQTQVVSEDTMLLEYALGEEDSFLWAVTPHSINGYQLPGRAVIEASVREVYDLLRKPIRSSTTRSAELVESASLAESPPTRGEAEYREASLKLSNMLLGPVARQLGGKRLILVTQGALQFIPFGALPVPSEAGGSQAGTPMVVCHEMVYLPSASLLPVLRAEAAGRKRPPRMVAVFADPVFGRNDQRVRRSPAGGGEERAESETPLGSVLQSATAKSSIPVVDGNRFERLPSTSWEADRIAALVPSDSMRALGFAANRTRVTDGALSQYRIIHFATHALVNNRQPELSGILLSTVNERGLWQDGFLSVNDIFNLRLSADLVVLSGCSTGLGKDVEGEGIIGLTRGFMYAGAPSVVVSLWNVEDRATAELMARFYESMLKEKLEPAAALRAAQIAMWRNGGVQPYYWAGFVLQGAGTLTK